MADAADLRPEDTRVLLVEDDDGSAEDYLRWLRARGYDVERAASFESAVARESSKQFDVVLLDLQLPSIDGAADEDTANGLRTLSKIVERAPLRPVVVLTAHSHNRELMREVLQRTRGGEFVFKDDRRLQDAIVAAVAVAARSASYRLSRSLDEFRALLDRDENEETYRRFIAEHWRAILGPEYIEVRSPHDVTRGGKIDLYAIRQDGFPDLWELKLPSASVFTKYNDWFCHSADTSKAIGQLMHYLDAAEKEPVGSFSFERRRSLVSIVPNRPRGFVVIGRYGREPGEAAVLRERVRLENRFLAGITLMTFDDLVERAEAYLRFLHEHRNGFSG